MNSKAPPSIPVVVRFSCSREFAPTIQELVGILTITDVIALHPVMQKLVEEEAKGKIPDRFMKRLRKR